MSIRCFFPNITMRNMTASAAAAGGAEEKEKSDPSSKRKTAKQQAEAGLVNAERGKEPVAFSHIRVRDENVRGEQGDGTIGCVSKGRLLHSGRLGRAA